MKKQTRTTKSQNTKMAVAMNRAVASRGRRHRVLGALALLGLFFCGFMVGRDVQNLRAKTHVEQKQIAMTVEQCNILADRIVNIANGIFCNSWEKDCVAEAKELNTIYSENCAGRIIVVQKPEQKPAPVPETTVSTCQQIENLLKQKIVGLYESDSESHIDNAKIYANLSERGCPENKQKFVDMAKQELQIARALEDDQFFDNEETLEVVETYKRLNMQAAAEEVFEKAKKLTNPAIDFILQVEKIINE